MHLIVALIKRFQQRDLVKMAKFVLKTNYFEFNGKVKQQISGTVIGTKFVPLYACIFMDEVDTGNEAYSIVSIYR